MDRSPGHPDILILADDPDAARTSAERLFEEVRSTLEAALPPSAEILHVGATAIPGCLTKGDLDVVVRIDPADFSQAEARLGALFARNPGSMRTDTFAAFEDAGRTPHLGIQLAARGGPLDVFHLFAAALRVDAGLVARYNALKRAHANRPMAAYRAAKDRFIAAVLEDGGAR